MTAEGAIEFEALEAQAASLMNVFVAAGYERVAPAFIQPASLFLDRIGEALRARTYVFTDPNLTIPVARVFLERGASLPARYCYNGPAFRIQEGKPDPRSPREFRQAGIEYFGRGGGGADPDVEVFTLVVSALRRSGLKDFVVRTGDLGLFSALLDSVSMPRRWRDRLAHALWRPSAFARELAVLVADEKQTAPALPSAALTEAGFLAYLDKEGIPFIGARRPAEVVARLNDKAADARARPLPKATARLIEDYLRIGGPSSAAFDAVDRLFSGAGLGLDAVLSKVVDLHETLAKAVAPAKVVFSADFGRHFEYYTGMVFQVEVEGAGIAGHIAGGGRYDGLIRALSGGEQDVPAVGAAIHTERLLAAVSKGL